MKEQIKLALRRFALRWLRKLVDVADDRLHTAEIALRNDLSDARDRQHPTRTVLRTEDMLHQVTDDQPPESESLSPQKGESHDPRNGTARTARHSADGSGVAQSGQQAARSAAIAARDAKPELPAHRHHETVSRKGAGETFAEWEARRSGVAVVTKREARRRRLSAREFDLRFAQ